MSIGVATRNSFGVKKSDITWAANQMNLTYQQVVNIIQNILSYTLNTTIADLEKWIDRFVPKRTGWLRDTLKQNLHSSRVKDNVLRLICGTKLDYSSDVNAMSTRQVRHSNTPKEHSGKWAYAYYYGFYGRIRLDDPQAIGNFFDKMLYYATQQIRINLLAAKRLYLGYVTYNKSPLHGVIKP
jgi:hypothetical protein